MRHSVTIRVAVKMNVASVHAVAVSRDAIWVVSKHWSHAMAVDQGGEQVCECVSEQVR